MPTRSSPSTCSPGSPKSSKSRSGSPSFDPDCRACGRLSSFLDQVAADYPAYHARPVRPFGADRPSLLIVGLAPGMHGANATGRPFTGDFAGILLYRTLYEYGFSNRPESVSLDDGLRLHGCRITNAVKCLPPQNKPTTDEVRCCNPFLKAEIEALPQNALILALGKIAHDAVLRALGEKLSARAFAHGAWHDVGGRHLVDSYHCSRYNTQTGRLTAEMFGELFARIRAALGRRTR